MRPCGSHSVMSRSGCCTQIVVDAAGDVYLVFVGKLLSPGRRPPIILRWRVIFAVRRFLPAKGS